MAGSRTDAFSPVMGTVLELVVQPLGQADRVADAVLAEIARLTTVLSGHEPNSELSRWRRGETDTVSTELATVLHAAHQLHRASGGAFHPAARPVTQAWQHAADRQQLPDRAEMLDLAAGLRDLPYRTRRADTGAPFGSITVERIGDCTAVDLDGLAKGYVVDAAVLVASRAVPDEERLGVTVNAGGDLRHLGRGSRRVRIEDPARPYDNAPPLTTIVVRRAALATSGTARRGVRVAGRRLGHIVDPRTGWPTQHTASASVLAPDTMTADAVATAATVLPAQAAMALVHGLGLACLLVCADGTLHTSTRWPVTGSGRDADPGTGSDADPDQQDARHGTDQPEHERGTSAASDGDLQDDPGQ